MLAAGGAAALAGVGLRVGRPVRPMLAASAPDVAGALTRTGLPAVVDAKLDGIRVQVHKDGAAVRVFTRSLDEITARVPEIVARVAEIPLDTAVIDGEALALDEAGAPRPFQVTAARSASAADPDRAGDIPLNLFCFDLLHLNGVDLLDLPLADRAAAMTSALPADLLVPRRLAATAAEVAEAFADAVGRPDTRASWSRTRAPATPPVDAIPRG